MQTVSTRPSLAQQSPALGALAQLTAAFGHLPGAHITVGSIYPDHITLSLHDNLGDFEQWRTALGIAPDTIEYKELSTQINLKGYAPFAGATVELVGYGLPLRKLAGQ